MTTATSLITDAMQDIGVLAAGQSPTSDDLTDGLRRLNNLLSSWSLGTLMVPFRTQISKVLDGSESYTVGSGGDIATVRPVAIESAYVNIGNSDYPVQVYRDRSFYDAITQKGISGIPQMVYYEPSVPLGRLFVWYVGDDSYTLYLNARGKLTSFPDMTTNVDLADGYDTAIHTNLAIYLAPVFETQVSQELVSMAQESKAEIKRLNRQKPVMSFDTAIPNHYNGFNIEVG